MNELIQQLKEAIDNGTILSPLITLDVRESLKDVTRISEMCEVGEIKTIKGLALALSRFHFLLKERSEQEAIELFENCVKENRVVLLSEGDFVYFRNGLMMTCIHQGTGFIIYDSWEKNKVLAYCSSEAFVRIKNLQNNGSLMFGLILEILAEVRLGNGKATLVDFVRNEKDIRMLISFCVRQIEDTGEVQMPHEYFDRFFCIYAKYSCATIVFKGHDIQIQDSGKVMIEIKDFLTESNLEEIANCAEYERTRILWSIMYSLVMNVTKFRNDFLRYHSSEQMNRISEFELFN